MINLFDTHCHMDDAAFDGDREAVIASLPQKGVDRILWCGTDLESSLEAASYAGRFGYIYFACGFFPHNTDKMDAEALRRLEELAKTPKCVAIGEIGLDYHYEGASRQRQISALESQLELARRVGLPAVLHERDALPDMLALLRRCGVNNGVIHCFSGSKETAREYLDMGLYISFTGLLTFKSARLAPEAAKFAPRDRVLIETDSPYMTPAPFRGERNDPSRVALVAARLAELWGISPQEAADITNENARRLFAIAK